MRSASPDCSPAYYLICLVYPFTAAVAVFVRWCWRNSVRTRPLVVLSLAGMFVIQLGGVVYRIRRDPYHREYLPAADRSEEHTSELQSLRHLVCRLLLEKIKQPAPSSE